MRGQAIGVVQESKSSSFPVGSFAIGSPGWTEYAIIKAKNLEKIELPPNARLTDAMGALGAYQSHAIISAGLD